MLTSSLLITASSNRNADVIIADSRFLFTSTSDLFSSWSFFSLAFQLLETAALMWISAGERYRILKRLYCRQSMGVIALFVCLLVVNVGQPSCSVKRMRRHLSKLQRRVLMLLLVAAGGSVLCCFGLASGCPAAGSRNSGF
ncbi:hypothetical protein F511_42037 [Dorcoceras hygrometricum]|uniref:Uncharacterized protein n=1 Tax=Dorcoceras hygrometricum TaxID=472368 RepID=A0A2Z7CST5_9LAMI|nr:hypothetical protein F511_42037 [Dorcoceras hygrometricum]